MRYLVEQLAAEEKEHFDLFKSLAKDPAIEHQILEKIQTPVEDHRFSELHSATGTG